MREKESMKSMIELSFGEEVGNTISHGVMSALLLLSLPFVAVYGYIKGGAVLSFGVSIFVISILLMFLTSCIYHAMPFGSKHKYVMRILDHSMIFIAIAGSYTPIALYVLSGQLGFWILIIQWSMVISGILYKSIAQNANPKITVAIFLVMGWIAIFFIPTLLQKSSPLFLGLIVLGGILYSIGAWFYSQKNRPYFHFIWHICINLASIAHFIAIVFFI